jgi:hypothetical protein
MYHFTESMFLTLELLSHSLIRPASSSSLGETFLRKVFASQKIKNMQKIFSKKILFGEKFRETNKAKPEQMYIKRSWK